MDKLEKNRKLKLELEKKIEKDSVEIYQLTKEWYSSKPKEEELSESQTIKQIKHSQYLERSLARRLKDSEKNKNLLEAVDKEIARLEDKEKKKREKQEKYKKITDFLKNSAKSSVKFLAKETARPFKTSKEFTDWLAEYLYKAIKSLPIIKTVTRLIDNILESFVGKIVTGTLKVATNVFLGTLKEIGRTIVGIYKLVNTVIFKPMKWINENVMKVYVYPHVKKFAKEKIFKPLGRYIDERFIDPLRQLKERFITNPINKAKQKIKEGVDFVKSYINKKINSLKNIIGNFFEKIGIAKVYRSTVNFFNKFRKKKKDAEQVPEDSSIDIKKEEITNIEDISHPNVKKEAILIDKENKKILKEALLEFFDYIQKDKEKKDKELKQKLENSKGSLLGTFAVLGGATLLYQFKDEILDIFRDSESEYREEEKGFMDKFKSWWKNLWGDEEDIENIYDELNGEMDGIMGELPEIDEETGEVRNGNNELLFDFPLYTSGGEEIDEKTAKLIRSAAREQDMEPYQVAQAIENYINENFTKNDINSIQKQEISEAIELYREKNRADWKEFNERLRNNGTPLIEKRYTNITPEDIEALENEFVHKYSKEEYPHSVPYSVYNKETGELFLGRTDMVKQEAEEVRKENEETYKKFQKQNKSMENQSANSDKGFVTATDIPSSLSGGGLDTLNSPDY